MFCSLRLVRAPPMAPLVAEAPRLFLLVQVGDLWLPAPAFSGFVVGVFPVCHALIEVEEVHLRKRRLKTDDCGCPAGRDSRSIYGRFSLRSWCGHPTTNIRNNSLSSLLFCSVLFIYSFFLFFLFCNQIGSILQDLAWHFSFPWPSPFFILLKINQLGDPRECSGGRDHIKSLVPNKNAKKQQRRGFTRKFYKFYGRFM